MNNNNNFDELLRRAGGSMGTSPDKLEQAAKNGKLGGLLKGMDKNTLAQVEKILKDREQTEKILNSPQAQELMKKLKKKRGSD